jgi:hypothetical protein
VIALARPRSNSTVNYRPVLSSERTHWKQNDVIVKRKKSKTKSGEGCQKEARYPDLLVDWLSAARLTPTPTPHRHDICNWWVANKILYTLRTHICGLSPQQNSSVTNVMMMWIFKVMPDKFTAHRIFAQVFSSSQIVIIIMP